jgi:hypothetical protein
VTLGSGVVAGNTVFYYVVAQDSFGTPNVSANPSAGAGGFSINPPAASTPPTTPNSYLIATGLSGSINVGTGETYTSLTNASGVFDTINTNVLVGNLTVNITSNLTGETGSIALNQAAEEGGGAGTYTITILPSVAARTVTGTGSGAVLIKLNGADRVTIDGSIGGGGSETAIAGRHCSTSGGGRVHPRPPALDRQPSRLVDAGMPRRAGPSRVRAPRGGAARSAVLWQTSPVLNDPQPESPPSAT